VDRTVRRGACGASSRPRLAAAVVHRGEEPAVAGERGTGNLFFSRCSLRCLFCQNHEISQGGRGRDVDERTLAEAMLRLQDAGVATIGLVTPTHFTPSIAAALRMAREQGLHLPVVHNGSAVDTSEALALLDGLVDVYLPDLKWWRSGLAGLYSGADWYPEVAREAILTMTAQVGPLDLDDDGLAVRGLLVRHLVLPGDAAGSLDLLAWLADAMPDCGLSLLRQYTPLHRATGDPLLGRSLGDDEYLEVLETARWLGFDPIYVQQRDSAEVGVPDWDDPEIFHFQ